MTSRDLSTMLLPYIRVALQNGEPDVRSQLGMLGWFAFQPGWRAICGPLLPWVTRVGVEIGIAVSARKALPVLKPLSSILDMLSSQYVTDTDKQLMHGIISLMETPSEEYLKPVADTMAMSDYYIQKFAAPQFTMEAIADAVSQG